MEKKFNENEKLEMLLDDQLIMEEEILEKLLFPEGGFEDYQETDEEREASYAKLMDRLEADGIYRKDEDYKETDSEKIMTFPKEKSVKKDVVLDKEELSKGQKKTRRYHSAARVAGILIVSGLCVFTASMTSEANRNYLMHNVRILTGRDTRDVTYNDETNENISLDESNAIAEIEKVLGVDVPEFMYRPENFEFLSYEVDSIAKIARVEYLYGEDVIVLFMDMNQNASITDISSLHGNDEEQVTISHDGEDVDLGKIIDDMELLPNCYARWRSNNVNYLFSGRMDFELLKEMINNMVY